MRRAVRLMMCGLPLAAMCPLPSYAQDPSNIWGGFTTNPKLASQMKAVCTNPNIAMTYAGYMLGYHVFDTGSGERVSIEKGNALAQEILDRARITDWTFVGWRGSGSEGQCVVHFALALAPEDAAHFNDDPEWGGNVTVAMTRETGDWTVRSFADGGARGAVSGWLAAWQKERENQPGGAPRLKPALSVQELAMKVSFARTCASHRQISDDLFPAYNAWLERLEKPVLLKFKVGSTGRLDAGRLISSSDQAIVCRYNIGTGVAGGNVDRSIHDLDMRFTVSGNKVKWEVISFPNAPASAFTFGQLDQLMSQIYVNGRQFKSEGDRGQSGASSSSSADGQTAKSEAMQ